MKLNTYTVAALAKLGISPNDINALARISRTLHRWHESECGDGYGCIERDDATGRPYYRSAASGRRTPIADRERGAMKRLGVLMTSYPELVHYVQGDCRGAPLYILRRDDVPADASLDSCYTRGIAV